MSNYVSSHGQRVITGRDDTLPRKGRYRMKQTEVGQKATEVCVEDPCKQTIDNIRLLSGWTSWTWMVRIQIRQTNERSIPTWAPDFDYLKWADNMFILANPPFLPCSSVHILLHPPAPYQGVIPKGSVLHRILNNEETEVIFLHVLDMVDIICTVCQHRCTTMPTAIEHHATHPNGITLLRCGIPGCSFKTILQKQLNTHLNDYHGAQ